MVLSILHTQFITKHYKIFTIVISDTDYIIVYKYYNQWI